MPQDRSDDESPEDFPEAPEQWPGYNNQPGVYVRNPARDSPLHPFAPPAGLYPTEDELREQAAQNQAAQQAQQAQQAQPYGHPGQNLSQDQAPPYGYPNQAPILNPGSQQPAAPTQGGVGAAGLAVALVSLFLPGFIGLAGGIVAVVLSSVALGKFRRGVHAGRGMAIAGLVIGIVASLPFG